MQQRSLLRILPTQSDVVGGVVMIAIGAFLVLAFTGWFELVLLVLGGLLALAGLATAVVTAIRRKGARAWVTSAILGIIGAALLVHNLAKGDHVLKNESGGSSMSSTRISAA